MKSGLGPAQTVCLKLKKLSYMALSLRRRFAHCGFMFEIVPALSDAQINHSGIVVDDPRTLLSLRMSSALLICSIVTSLFDDEDDPVDKRADVMGLRKRKDRRRIDDNVAVGVAALHISHKLLHPIRGQELNGILNPLACRQQRQLRYRFYYCVADIHAVEEASARPSSGVMLK